MKASSNLSMPLSNNTFFVFWMGVLTSAVIIGLIFSYQAYKMANFQDAILKGGTTQFMEIESS
ncbi:MAG: hypothetical protein ACD_28C00133G0011 [uncultured bacterium]|nr:MAG: hypothetical protein ACD_28C00133G0011 [uncultured bacterium]KKT75281.1 MAG: hypothetical protein UW70_C0036G0005 [Candidatus Peregrinibacteria bacterium GW2011_GWA2_44_7]